MSDNLTWATTHRRSRSRIDPVAIAAAVAGRHARKKGDAEPSSGRVDRGDPLPHAGRPVVQVRRQRAQPFNVRWKPS
jgi:hypothetical protein